MPIHKTDPVRGRGWGGGWWAVQTVISEEERVGEGKR